MLANGNVYSAQKAAEVLKITGARGLMIGRGAIRNPWLFRQIREHQRGEALFIPRGIDVLAYVRALYEAVCSPAARESAQVQKMKKYMNYLGVGVEPTGQFLHQIRRVTTTADLFRVCGSSWTTTGQCRWSRSRWHSRRAISWRASSGERRPAVGAARRADRRAAVSARPPYLFTRSGRAVPSRRCSASAAPPAPRRPAAAPPRCRSEPSPAGFAAGAGNRARPA